MAFDFASGFRPGLPAPAQKWNGFAHFDFTGGHNDADSMPVEGLRRALDAVLAREGRTLATYGLESGPQGYRPLREFLVAALRNRAGIECNADEILITSGSLQALDLINQVFVAPGDTVLIEEATYGGAITRLQRLGANIVGVPLDEGGIDVAALSRILGGLKANGVKPKFIYTIPTVQNPTGSVMPLERRKALLALAREYDVPIFEDDCYADLVFDGKKRPPAIQAIDEDGRVVYCGSFSKSIAPALRVGFIVAPWAVMSRILALKTDAGTGALEQMAVAAFAAEQFDAHVDRLTAALTKKRDAIVAALEKEFGTAAEFTVPAGGIFIWVRIPERVDTSALAAAAAKEGVQINPGAEWSVNPVEGKRSFRLCFAHPSVETIAEGVAKLAEICHREFGLPERGGNVRR